MQVQALNRCDWCIDNPLYMAYHDQEWGVPVHDDLVLFEFLILESMQAGLSWLTILKKRDNFRRAFANFDPEKVACFTDEDQQRLMQDAGIIRNRLKIESAINNAKQFLVMQTEYGSFSKFLWDFVGGQPIQNHYKQHADIPAKTELSDKLSKTLKKQGFRFVGSTICYAYMQAVGLVNDHVTTCHCYNVVVSNEK